MLSVLGDLNVVKSLIESGSNVNTQENDQTTPLHYAALKGNWLCPITFLSQHL